MSAVPKVIILTTVQDSRVLEKLADYGSVAPLVLDQSLHSTLDAMDAALDRYLPTSLAKANSAWLSPARELGRLLSLQIAAAGIHLESDRTPGAVFTHRDRRREGNPCRYDPVPWLVARNGVCDIAFRWGRYAGGVSCVAPIARASAHCFASYCPCLYLRSGGDFALRDGRCCCYHED